MTHNEQVIGIAAEPRDIVFYPAQYLGTVGDELGKAHLRVDAVIRYHGDDSLRRERLRDESVVCAIAGLPAATVKKYNHRSRCFFYRCRRGVDVELLAGQRPVG